MACTPPVRSEHKTDRLLHFSSFRIPVHSCLNEVFILSSCSENHQERDEEEEETNSMNAKNIPKVNSHSLQTR